MVRLSLTDPRVGVRQILAMNIPRPYLWQALALTVVLSVLVAFFISSLTPSAPPGTEQPLNEMERMVRQVAEYFASHPIAQVFMLGAFDAFSVVMLYAVGRMAGGTGDFDGALATVAWFSFVMLIVNAAFLLLTLAMPFLAVLLAVARIVIYLSVLTRFVAELHGFDQLIGVFFGIILSLAALSLILAFLFAMFFATFIGFPANV